MLSSLFWTEGDEMNDEQTDDSDYDIIDGRISERKHLSDSSDDELGGDIVPLRDLNGHMEELIFCCKLALEHYREKEGINLKFVKVLKANVRSISPVVFLYYITFEARDSRKEVDVYQAEACYHFHKKELCEVSIMRPKPKPADGVSSSGHHVRAAPVMLPRIGTSSGRSSCG